MSILALNTDVTERASFATLSMLKTGHKSGDDAAVVKPWVDVNKDNAAVITAMRSVEAVIDLQSGGEKNEAAPLGDALHTALFEKRRASKAAPPPSREEVEEREAAEAAKLEASLLAAPKKGKDKDKDKGKGSGLAARFIATDAEKDADEADRESADEEVEEEEQADKDMINDKVDENGDPVESDDEDDEEDDDDDDGSEGEKPSRRHKRQDSVSGDELPDDDDDDEEGGEGEEGDSEDEDDDASDVGGGDDAGGGLESDDELGKKKDKGVKKRAAVAAPAEEEPPRKRLQKVGSKVAPHKRKAMAPAPAPTPAPSPAPPAPAPAPTASITNGTPSMARYMQPRPATPASTLALAPAGGKAKSLGVAYERRRAVHEGYTPSYDLLQSLAKKCNEQGTPAFGSKLDEAASVYEQSLHALTSGGTIEQYNVALKDANALIALLARDAETRWISAPREPLETLQVAHAAVGKAGVDVMLTVWPQLKKMQEEATKLAAMGSTMLTCAQDASFRLQAAVNAAANAEAPPSTSGN